MISLLNNITIINLPLGERKLKSTGSTWTGGPSAYKEKTFFGFYNNEILILL